VIRAWEILGGKNYPPVDLLIPVPLSTTTLAKRGFNQAWELCKQMSSHNKVSTSSRLLKKMNCRQDPPMGKLMRGRHLKQTFFLDEVELCKIGGLENKRVGVVDDLMDSGATLNAIATILKENGASWVSNWIILRTPSPELY
jgi:predicted amidophosphoribosyltransferase